MAAPLSFARALPYLGMSSGSPLPTKSSHEHIDQPDHFQLLGSGLVTINFIAFDLHFLCPNIQPKKMDIQACQACSHFHDSLCSFLCLGFLCGPFQPIDINRLRYCTTRCNTDVSLGHCWGRNFLSSEPDSSLFKITASLKYNSHAQNLSIKSVHLVSVGKVAWICGHCHNSAQSRSYWQSLSSLSHPE
jgi:hypothetical protein